jgi:hypothetical protein
MMRLELQFIHTRKIPWIGLSVLCGTFIATLFVNHTWVNLKASVSNLQERSSTLTVKLKEQQRLMMQSQMEVSPAEELRKSEQKKILTALQYPWSRVLASIELPDEKDVAILSFKHDQESQISQLNVEALAMQSIIRFVEKMNKGDTANHWYIASYQIQNQHAPATVKASILNQ